MGNYRIDISDVAEGDLLDILSYISSQFSAPLTALSMLDLIESAIDGLSNMLQRYALAADEMLSVMGYRKLIVKNYIVFFTIDEQVKVVDVVRILYARRDWQNIL